MTSFTIAGVDTNNASLSVKLKTFTPSGSIHDLTMDGTAQTIRLSGGTRMLRIVNQGATTEAIRICFGQAEVEAQTGLAIASAAATRGLWVGAAVDGFGADLLLGVPAAAAFVAVANAVASDTQAVQITQGV